MCRVLAGGKLCVARRNVWAALGPVDYMGKCTLTHHIMACGNGRKCMLIYVMYVCMYVADFDQIEYMVG